jgi:hypothetical protein
MTDYEEQPTEEPGGAVFDEDAYEKDRDEQGIAVGYAGVDFTEWNTDYLKNMQPGDGATYWLDASIGKLLIGEQMREKGDWAKQHDPTNVCEGTITMVARGSTLSSGEVEVTGCANEDLFKGLFRNSSNKKITFG